jgi:hypothetical protein
MPPVCVQPVVFVEVQEIVKACPDRTVVGVSDIEAAGAGAGLTVRVTGLEVTLRPFRLVSEQVTVST